MGFESINQPGRSSEVERNPKMSIFFLARQGGRWGWSQAFNFFWTREGWWTGFESIDLPGQSSEVKCNPKMSILFFWLEMGGRWGSSSPTSPGNHQKLNVIQKWAFYFLAGEGWQMGFESIDQPGWSSEVECNPKMSILFFGWRGAVAGFWVHWPAQPIIRS